MVNEYKEALWSFPELEELGTAPMQVAFEPWLSSLTPSLSKEEKAKQELKSKMAEVEKKEANLNSSLQTLENMFKKLKNPFSVMEADIIETINTIVKKMAQRFIHREIDANPEIISKIIDELKKQVPANDSIISINVSMSDYKFLREHTTEQNLYLPDPSLSPGDIVIRCNFAEVHAHINRSIETMLSIKHE